MRIQPVHQKFRSCFTFAHIAANSHKNSLYRFWGYCYVPIRNAEQGTDDFHRQISAQHVTCILPPKGSALVTAPIMPYFSRSQSARKRLPETEALLGELFLTAPDGILNAATSKRAVLIFSIERDRRSSQSAQRFCRADMSPSAGVSPMRFHSRFAHFRPIKGASSK